MANSTDKSILTAAGKALLAQLNAEEKALVIDKMIFANVPNRPEYPQPDDVVPTDHIVHQEQVEQRGRLSADSVIYSTTLTSDVGPFDFNWTGAYCSEYGVLVTIDHHALTPKTADEPGVAGNTLVRSVVLEYKDIAEITNITVDASSWQYNATERMKKMDSDVAQSIIDQNGKDWFIEDGFLVTPSGSAYSIKAGAGYVSGNRVAMEFDRSVQVPNKPSFIYIDAHREGTPTGEQVTLFNFVVTAEEKDDYIDSSTGKDVKHFVCKIAQVHADGSVSDFRPESSIRDWVNKGVTNNILPFNSFRTVSDKLNDIVSVKDYGARGDGETDDTESIRAALETRKPVFFPAGDYKITGLLRFYAGQQIYGQNDTSEKSIFRPSQMTIITQHTKDIGVFEHMSYSTALGCSFKNLMIRTHEQSTPGAGNAAIQVGEWGATTDHEEWWKMQSIRCRYENLFIMGFDIGMSVTGWSWESTYTRCYFFRCSQIGARIGTGGTGITQFAHCSFVHINSSGGAIGSPISGIGLLVEDSKVSLNDTRFEATDGTGLLVKGGEVDCFTPYFESNLGHHITVGDSESGIKDTDGISRVRTYGGIWAHGITHFSLLRSDGQGAHQVIMENVKSYSFGSDQQPTYGEFHLPNLNTDLQVINYEGNADVLFNNWNGCPTLFTLKKYPGVVFTRKAPGTLADVLIVNCSGVAPAYVVPHTNVWTASNGDKHSAQDLLSFAKGKAFTRDAIAEPIDYILRGPGLRYFHETLSSKWFKRNCLYVYGHANTGGLDGKTIDATEMRGVRAPNYSNVDPTITCEFDRNSLFIGRQFFIKDMTGGTGAVWTVNLQLPNGNFETFVLPQYAYSVFELQDNTAGGEAYWEIISQSISPRIAA